MPASPNETLVLGIETSCDETAAAVVARDGATGRGRIVSNVVRSQWEQHRAYGGVVPEIAARAHVECLDDIVREAMQTAGVGFAELDAIAATAGPGLVGGLIVGLTTAKALALAHGKPFVAVNHLEAHALTVGLTDEIPPPYLLLLVSGGHTQLLLVDGDFLLVTGDTPSGDPGSVAGRPPSRGPIFRRLGTTIDDALGEAFDKTAKLLGLGFPGGPAVERTARGGDPKRFALPRPMQGRDVPHFSFAGLKTAVRQTAMSLTPLHARDVADLCASFEAAVADCVRDRVGRAMTILEADQGLGRGDNPAGYPRDVARRLVVAGGVAANLRLRSMLQVLCGERGYTFHAPPLGLCSDNAAMISWVGALRHAQGRFDPLDFAARARWPLDADATAAIGSGRLGTKA